MGETPTLHEAPPAGLGDSVVELPSVRLNRLAHDAAADLQLAGLSGLGDADGSGLSEQALADIRTAVAGSTSANTKAAYRSDWTAFTAWCTIHGLPALPASPLLVAHYLTEAATLQTNIGRWRYTPATLSRWASTINQFHTAAGLDPPGRSEVVRRALSGIRRIRATPPVRRAPLLLADIRTLLTSIGPLFPGWPAGVAARRDTALLLMGFTAAARRSELVALTLGDVTLHRADGLHLRVNRSKTDQEARGSVKALPYGQDPVICPPCAFIRWRLMVDAADRTDPDDPSAQRRALMVEIGRQTRQATAGDGGAGHVCRVDLPDPADPGRALFPTVHKTGRISGKRMSGDAVNEMIRRRAAAAGFTTAQVNRLGGHSLRAGFVTEAFRQGADAHAIMRQTGHTNPAMLEVYAREHAPLVGNAVTQLKL